MTERCSACGADLSPDISWCPRCYAPVLRAVARSAAPERDEFADDIRFVPANTRIPRPEERRVADASLVRGSATTFGPAVKMALTVGFVVVGLAALPLVTRWNDLPGRTGPGFVFFYAGLLILAAVLVLAQIWRHGRVR